MTSFNQSHARTQGSTWLSKMKSMAAEKLATSAYTETENQYKYRRTGNKLKQKQKTHLARIKIWKNSLPYNICHPFEVGNAAIGQLNERINLTIYWSIVQNVSQLWLGEIITVSRQPSFERPTSNKCRVSVKLLDWFSTMYSPRLCIEWRTQQCVKFTSYKGQSVCILNGLIWATYWSIV